MTTGAGGLAGAAIGIAFLGIGLGVAGSVVKQTSKSLKLNQTKRRRTGLKKAGIY